MPTTGVEIPVVTGKPVVRAVAVRRMADPVHRCTTSARGLRPTMHADHLVRLVDGLVVVKRNLVCLVRVLTARTLSVASLVGVLSLSAWGDVPHDLYASS